MNNTCNTSSIAQFYKGDSVSITIVISHDYDIGNMEDLVLYLNNTALDSSKVLPTIDPRVYRVQLSSNDTMGLGNVLLGVAIDDSQLGVIKKSIGYIYFKKYLGYNNESVNVGSNITVNLTITDLGVISDVLLANIYKGDKGEDGVGGNGQAGRFNQSLIGIQNGINKIFTTAFPYTTTKTRIYLNGLRLKLTDDYTESGAQTITFVEAPFSTDNIIIDY